MYKVILKFLFLFIIINFCNALFAQNIKGIVYDESKTELAGVNIINISNGNFTISNYKGNFKLDKVNLGDSLLFTYLGFSNKKLVVKNLNKPLEVVLNFATLNLNEVTISSNINALNIITDIDIKTKPVNNSQTILQTVPGLFIGQHAGGGKAEQIFLRGFDIDHGTDINLTVDDLPVNMVSHAHGQGYSDLHFVIPETINKLDFGKGAYYADKGNFNTAGYVNFRTKNKIDDNLIKVEAGRFNEFRLMGMLNLLNNEKHNLYAASEYLLNDGPFESPQNFNRFNLFTKYFAETSPSNFIGFTASYFSSKWSASGQIPERAVDSNLIDRFGAIDDTEGGKTSRTNLIFNHSKILNNKSSLTNKIFYSKYDFELFSNFTFFLNDSINGDQIKQKEDRNLVGLKSEFKSTFNANNFSGDFTIGLNLRNDIIKDNELSRTKNKTETLNQLKFGNINETNAGVYLSSNFQFNKLRINTAIRADHFYFKYKNAISALNETDTYTSTIVSPKLNFLYNYSPGLQLYLKSGKGFHSNDTRVNLNNSLNKTIPSSYGYDVGFIWKTQPKLLVNLAYWYLFLEQEFVYVGDEGIVEPSGKSKRQGLDLSLRYQPKKWLILNFDANYAFARFTEENTNEQFIPLAPDFTIESSINILPNNKYFTNATLRYIDDRPANEDNSIIAKGYTLVDLNAGYNFKKTSIGFQIKNLFNVVWNETQFATESQLIDETEPTEEIHFTPGTPFTLKGIFTYRF